MSNTPYHFEQDRKLYCNEVAYFLRNPNLDSETKKQILEQLRESFKIISEKYK